MIVEENRSVSDVAAHMPFLMSRARADGTATNFYAISHPSLPNYLVLAGGSTFGVADDDVPAAHRLHGPSLFGQLLAAGRTAKTYAEAMPGNCAVDNRGVYAVRHNPWTYFEIEPSEALATSLMFRLDRRPPGPFSTTSPPENCRPSVCWFPASATTVTTARPPGPTTGFDHGCRSS